ncbi:MAG: DUF547 domain-containing protein [Deltaproteobacteria bacterium]|nr:DUF547 domain-containing protein [Deltaproteobacteria bacterium]
MKINRMTITATLFLMLISMVSAINVKKVQAASSDYTPNHTIDHTIFDKLLNQYVVNGVVDYKGLKKEEATLDRYLTMLEIVKPDSLSRNDRFAFYINVYNAWTIKLILTGYPDIESIKDMGSLFKSPWKKKIVRINGDVVTLDYIEHEILRPDFKDSRVHFAINCAAKSCPPLRSEAYQGSSLDYQLDDSTSSFINDPQMNYLKGEKLYISKIFDWFEEDFNGVHRFFLQYARGNLKKELIRIGDKVRIKHLDYDWDLNGS